MMSSSRSLLLATLLFLLVFVAACSSGEPTATTPPEAPKAKAYVFNNESPHIVEIDAETNEVLRSVDLPELNGKQWSWIDSKTYYDGTNLWASIIDYPADQSIIGRDPDSGIGGDSRILLVDLDTLTATEEIDVGPEKFWLYIGQPTRDGRLFVGKHGAHQVAVIDTKTREVLETIDVPVPEVKADGMPIFWATCDMAISIGADGVERAFYPTWNGDTVVSLSNSGEILEIADFPDTGPVMLSTAPDGTVWVQELTTKTNVVLDPVTLDVLGRFSAAGASDVSFSPDGKLAYLGTGTSLTVVDTETYLILRTVEVGGGAGKSGAHPNGRFIYINVGSENTVAVVDTSTWEVVSRIDVGTSPGGLFVRAVDG